MQLTFQVKIGQYTVTILHDRPDEEAPAADFFPKATPEELQEARDRFGLQEPLIVSHNNLLVQTPEANVLVDAGWGKAFEERQGHAIEALAEIGVTPGDIDKLIITHAHVDHYGGLLTADGQKMFPNAQYLMWREEWEYYSSQPYLSGVDVERKQVMTTRFLPIRQYVEFLDETSTQIVEGVRVIHAPGHTPNHLVVEVEDGDESLLAMIDAMIHPLHLNFPHWHWAFEYDPAQLEETRRALIELALRKNALVALYHGKFPGLGRIERVDAETVVWKPHTP